MCFHSQGEVIYWKYKDFLPKNSLELAKEFAHVSGYELEDTPYNSSFGGLREEFINAVFKEDLLELYKEKDLAKKNIKERKIIERL